MSSGRKYKGAKEIKLPKKTEVDVMKKNVSFPFSTQSYFPAVTNLHFNFSYYYLLVFIGC